MKKNVLLVVVYIAMFIVAATNMVLCVGSAINDLFMKAWTWTTIGSVVLKVSFAVGIIVLFNAAGEKLGFQYPDGLSVDEASQPLN